MVLYLLHMVTTTTIFFLFAHSFDAMCFLYNLDSLNKYIKCCKSTEIQIKPYETQHAFKFLSFFSQMQFK